MKITRNKYYELLGNEIGYKKINKLREKPAKVISTITIYEPLTFKEKYHNFLNSSFWKAKRKKILNKHPFCCICGSKFNLQVHHIWYDKLFSNLISIINKRVVVVCKQHHELFHKKYELKGDMRQEWKEFLAEQKPSWGKGLV